MTFTLVLGGARAGKSAYAQRQAEAKASGRLVMIATAEARDAEMAERITRHRAERGPRWTTVEAPRDLAGVLAGLDHTDIAVADCLTLWASNMMEHESDMRAARARLAEAFAMCRATVWAISNEVGLGIVPDNALARRYRDEIGRLHQDLAQIADHVVLLVAGLPLTIK